ncbi:MAG: ABC transporter ATP-binding protein [Deltaproteobacteria bacterium]|nr:ABC transporter ATP-binding protein [Deltaproteobacteria bacterium]
MKVEIRDAICGYDGKPVVTGASLSIREGEVLCLLGPNGSGKTTLFKSILGLLRLQGGTIVLDGDSIEDWPRRKIAHYFAYVPQIHSPSFPFNVMDMVLLGRTAHLGNFSTPTAKDKEIASDALDMLGIHHLKEKIYTEISGGERQLVLIARALAQQPHFLVMDEPTANLDFGNQMLVLSHVQYLAGLDIGVVMSSHFPDHAFSYASTVLLIKDGVIFGFGSPKEIITEKNLKSLYGVDVKIVEVDVGDKEQVLLCVPVSSNTSGRGEINRRANLAQN